MADVQIVAGGTSAAPLAYTVPGAAEIVLKSLYAEFNGAAAASAWFPCVRIIAPGGKVVGEYVTQSSVAAGGSADVSFGPFLRGAAAAATSTGATLPIAQASDIDTTITSAADTTMNLNDWFGTTDSSVFGTQVVAGKTYLQVKTSGIYRAQACCIASDNVDTGPLALNWLWNFGLGTVDSSEFDGGQQLVVNFTSGGLNRWLVTSDTYFGINNPSSTAVTIKMTSTALSGNLSTQHTDVILSRIGPYVANVFL